MTRAGGAGFQRGRPARLRSAMRPSGAQPYTPMSAQRLTRPCIRLGASGVYTPSFRGDTEHTTRLSINLPNNFQKETPPRPPPVEIECLESDSP